MPEYGFVAEPIPQPMTHTTASSVGSGDVGRTTGTSVVTDTSGCTPAAARTTMPVRAAVAVTVVSVNAGTTEGYAETKERDDQETHA